MNLGTAGKALEIRTRMPVQSERPQTGLSPASVTRCLTRRSW